MLTKQPSSKISKDNVPYTPKHLPISLDGVAEDDFTLVLVIQEKPTNTYHQ
jgi:hypothetical protein